MDITNHLPDSQVCVVFDETGPNVISHDELLPDDDLLFGPTNDIAMAVEVSKAWWIVIANWPVPKPELQLA